MTKLLLPKTVWFLFLLIPLTFIGFYPSYFSKLFTPLPPIFHAHTFFLVLWIILALTQPLLIHLKKYDLHKKVGIASYFIMPMVVLAIYFMISHSYYKELERMSSDEIRTKYSLTSEEIFVYAAAYQIKAIIAFLWLIAFYCLGIVYRRRPIFHATYMLAAILVLIGPSLDRIIFPLFHRFQLPTSGPAEYFTFTLVFFVLVMLLVHQKKNGYTIRPAATAIAIHLVGVLGYTLLPMTTIWRSFVEAIV